MNTPVKYHMNGFPPSNLDLKALNPLLGKANRAMGAYDVLLSVIPNQYVFLSPLVTREAVLSSKIEGMNVSVSDVMRYDVGLLTDLSENKQLDAEEVKNYREALMYASDEILATKKFHLKLLRETHEILLSGVRGKDYNPGEFRRIQNWIGAPKSTQDKAEFIPIEVEYLDQGIKNWLEFYQNENIDMDPLLQLALMHIEFEAIHPFLDGNGRLGRILIPLFMFERGILRSPNFYLSDFLDTNRDEYLSRMRDVSKSKAWTEWCVFFLEGIIHQAEDNINKIKSILDLHERIHDKVLEVTNSRFSKKIADVLVSYPFFESNRLTNSAGMSKANSTKILKKLGEDGTIKIIQNATGRRGRIYLFSPLLDIIK